MARKLSAQDQLLSGRRPTVFTYPESRSDKAQPCALLQGNQPRVESNGFPVVRRSEGSRTTECGAARNGFFAWQEGPSRVQPVVARLEQRPLTVTCA